MVTDDSLTNMHPCTSAARHPRPPRHSRTTAAGIRTSLTKSCWSPLNLPYDYTNFRFDEYVVSRRPSEQELLRHNESSGGSGAFEVVMQACRLLGGDTVHLVLSSKLSSVKMVVPALMGNEIHHNTLCFMQVFLGSVPLVHIEDACEAHLFCMDQPSLADQFLCATGYATIQDYVTPFAAKYPEHKILLKKLSGEGVRVSGHSSKLVELGFRFKYSMEEMLDCSVECAQRMGEL